MGNHIHLLMEHGEKELSSIHQNLVKAGTVKKPLDYRRSSCSSYYGNKEYLIKLIDRERVHNI